MTRHLLRDFIPDFHDLESARAFLGQLAQVNRDMREPVTLTGAFPLTLGLPEQNPEEGDWSWEIVGGPTGLWGDIGEMRLLEWRQAVQRLITELNRHGDAHPHAAYLAVTEDGEIIGEAGESAAATFLLNFTVTGALPARFRLLPHHPPEGGMAPALACRTVSGVVALARGKTTGEYDVHLYRDVSVWSDGSGRRALFLDAVRQPWLWKRLQELVREANAVPT